jgi:hypothetical protein
VALLIYLVQFYDIQGYETWRSVDARTNSQKSGSDFEDEEEDNEDDNSESGPDSEASLLSLEEAVRTYPHTAVEALAPIIGLVEADFDSFRARAAEFKQKPQPQVTKRQADPIDRAPSRRGAKRSKWDEKWKTRSPIPEPKPSIPLHQLLASPKPSDPSSEKTRLEWDNTSALEAIKKILDRAKKGKSKQNSPEAQAEGSTVSEVQSVLDQYRGKSVRQTSSEAFPGSPTEVAERSPKMSKSPSAGANG